MNFSSLKEYFYKIYNVCYLITLIPLGIFIYLYLQLQVGKIIPVVQDAFEVMVLQIIFAIAVVMILTIVHLVVKRKMKSLRSEVSLGTRMDVYYILSIVRTGTGALASLIIAVGLFLTNSQLSGVLFLMILAWIALQWPTPKKLCNDLLLKGDERELVINKRDSLI